MNVSWMLNNQYPNWGWCCDGNNMCTTNRGSVLGCITVWDFSRLGLNIVSYMLSLISQYDSCLLILHLRPFEYHMKNSSGSCDLISCLNECTDYWCPMQLTFRGRSTSIHWLQNQGEHSAYTHTGGSVRENFRQPKINSLASLQPNNISSFYSLTPASNADRGHEFL